MEEFSIQFIEGEAINASLFQALRIYQGNFQDFLEVIKNWSDDEKVKVIIAVEELGYTFSLRDDDPNQLDVTLHEVASLRDLAVDFVDEGLFGEIPECIQPYIDYDAIARDLGMDYGEIIIDGKHYVYRYN